MDFVMEIMTLTVTETETEMAKRMEINLLTEIGMGTGMD